MIFRFLYTFIVGVICLVAISLFGQLGLVALVPIAFLPIFKYNTTLHENIYKLLHKVNSYMLGLIIFGYFKNS